MAARPVVRAIPSAATGGVGGAAVRVRLAAAAGARPPPQSMMTRGRAWA